MNEEQVIQYMPTVWELTVAIEKLLDNPQDESRYKTVQDMICCVYNNTRTIKDTSVNTLTYQGKTYKIPGRAY